MATAMSQTSKTDYRLGFTSLEEETAVDSLPVTGQLPAWLSGALVRVTPAKLEVGERRLDHWFDGIAMLNRFGIADGRVSYKSRFIDSVAYRDSQEGEWRHGGFATDPCRTLFKRVQSMFSPDVTDNPNVNLVKLGERYIAMTETPMPIEFDAELETVGQLDYADKLKAHVTTAHPHHDFERDELVNYHAFFSRVSKYVLYGLPAGSSTRRVIAELPVKQPAYMHAFGMSGRHLILAEYPLRANPLKLAFSGKPFIENYVWRPEEGTKFQVVDRDTGRLRGTYTTDAFFCFHHVNAFERADGSELVIDLVAYDDASIIDALYLDDEGVRGPLPRTELRRYVIDLEGGGVSWEKLGENVELPRINYGSHNTRPYRYAYFAGTGGEWIDHLAKIDLEDGTRLEWSAPDCYPGEPVFVRESGAADEDAGVVLSVVLDAAAGRSFLLVLDARSFEELARAEAPHHIPFGFHGQFVRASG
jgi:beta,beta-carotene 9',10'-dioxygenase